MTDDDPALDRIDRSIPWMDGRNCCSGSCRFFRKNVKTAQTGTGRDQIKARHRTHVTRASADRCRLRSRVLQPYDLQYRHVAR